MTGLFSKIVENKGYMKLVSPASVGMIGELKATIQLLEQGYIVSKPCVHDRKYDIIVDNKHGSLFRVQVKTISAPMTREGRPFYWVSFNVRARSGIKKPMYKKGDFDFFVIYLRDIKVFYIIPHSVVDKKIDLKLFPYSNRSKYEKYRGSWELFA